MKVSIRPSIISGRLSAPPSKSMAHRLLISAALSEGSSIISNVAESEDILATISCLRSLGASIKEIESGEGEYKILSISGTDPAKSGETVLDCNESGSTLRFLIPIAALSDSEIRMSGSRTLMSRPLSVYEEIFKKQGLVLDKTDAELRVRGRLRGGEFTIPANISSQFVSGLLFALPPCETDSVIRLEGKVESRPYIDMTMQALECYGVRSNWSDDHTVSVPGSQSYRASDMRVEGDWSNAAYLMALGAEVDGLDESSLQGDKICREYFAELGNGCAELDISDCPDLGPALMAYAAMNHGCNLTGSARLRIKESDRGSAMKEELAKFGVDVEIHENSIKVGCGLSEPREALQGHNDHRVVMALAALCTKTGGVIEGAEAVAKSFPDYFEKISEIGAIIIKEH